MGIDIINFGQQQGESGQQSRRTELSPLTFATHRVQTPPMSIWLMSAAPNKPLFPWWGYNPKYDESMKRLTDFWNVSSPQTFFDCLFLSQLRKQFGQNLYVLFPGNIHVDGWDTLPDSSKSVFSKGQECIYHMEGAFSGRLTINWVPLSHSHRLVKNPSFSDLWKLYLASRSDDPVMCLSYLVISNPRVLPEAIQLLIRSTDKRSEELSHFVDWFGMYSSPVNPDFSACSVAYTQFEKNLSPIQEFQKQFSDLLEQARFALTSAPTPDTAIRILSRLVAL